MKASSDWLKPLDPPSIWLPLICRDERMREHSLSNPDVLLSRPLQPCLVVNTLKTSGCDGRSFSRNHLCRDFIYFLSAGGFIFKQWKKRFLLLTSEGALTVSHDAASPPDQLVLLQSSCEAIVEGKEILDLPKLPSGGCRDCCFALILVQNKYLLLLTETPSECRSLSLSPQCENSNLIIS